MSAPVEVLCPVILQDEIPCGKPVNSHCPTVGTGYGCGWTKCTDGHTIDSEGHLMGENRD